MNESVAPVSKLLVDSSVTHPRPFSKSRGESRGYGERFPVRTSRQRDIHEVTGRFRQRALPKSRLQTSLHAVRCETSCTGILRRAHHLTFTLFSIQPLRTDTVVFHENIDEDDLWVVVNVDDLLVVGSDLCTVETVKL